MDRDAALSPNEWIQWIEQLEAFEIVATRRILRFEKIPIVLAKNQMTLFCRMDMERVIEYWQEHPWADQYG